MASRLIKVARGQDEEMLGYGLLAKGTTLYKQNRLKEAIEITEEYKDINAKFRTLAKVNRLLYLVGSGQAQYIDELLDYAKETRLDIEITIKTVMESYLRDNRLRQIEKRLSNMGEFIKPIEDLANPMDMKQYLHIHYLLAIYHFRRNKEEEGIHQILITLELAEKLGNDAIMKKCSLLFYDNVDAHCKRH